MVSRQEWFEGMYRDCYDPVLRYAARRTAPDAARDVTAEVFLVAWRRRGQVPASPGRQLPWLYGVARRVLADHRRAQGRQERLQEALKSREMTAGTGTHSFDTKLVAVRQALARLPERDREVLYLIAWEELDLAGAAVALGCSRGTAAVRLHRARARLAKQLSRTETADIKGKEPSR